MDKRTVEGKTFQALESNDEKSLFLLEKIYDKLDDIRTEQRNTRLETTRQQRFSALQIKCLVFLAQSNNTNTQACEKYRQYLQNELTNLVPDHNWSWGKGKGWSDS